MLTSMTKFAGTLALLAGALALPQTAAAGDKEDACAAWLCLPVGFAVPECAPAYKAMLKRTARLKPPLPGLAGCLAYAPDEKRHPVSGDFRHTKRNVCAGNDRRIYGGKEDLVLSSEAFGSTGISSININNGDICVPADGSGRVYRPQDNTEHTVIMTIEGQTYSYTYDQRR